MILAATSATSAIPMYVADIFAVCIDSRDVCRRWEIDTRGKCGFICHERKGVMREHGS